MKTRFLLVLTMMALSAAASAVPVTYKIDPDHTYPSFEADHLGVSVWRGKLNKTAGKVVLDKAAGTGTLEVSVDPASIDFGLPALNRWARGAQFFDAQKYPKVVYKARLDGFVAGVPSLVVGELTLHGVTRPVVLKINALKCIPHPIFKRELCGADALGTFSRDDFGLDAGKDYGFNMDVTLRIQVEALQVE
jgi:polyisoprenoid-binding protein YceI